MDNENNKQIEDIFEDIKPGATIKKEKYSSENSEKPPIKPSKNSNKGGKDIFVLTARLLIIFSIIIIIGFGGLYLWHKFGNENILTEDEVLIKPADNATSTPSVVVKEPKEKPLDTDTDGLTDTEERQLGTRIDSSDTDQDGLSDRLEVKIYFTNPLNADTDQDGMSDREEVEKGLNPDDPTPGAKLFDLKEEIEKL